MFLLIAYLVQEYIVWALLRLLQALELRFSYSEKKKDNSTSLKNTSFGSLCEADRIVGYREIVQN